MCADTLKSWLKLSGFQPASIARQNCEDNRRRELEAELRLLRMQLADKDEVIAVLKIHRHTFRSIVDKFRFVDSYRSEFSVDLLCLLLKISRSGYYAWKNRGLFSRRINEQFLLGKLIQLHEKHPASGLDSLLHTLNVNGIPCSRNRLHRLMKKYNIHSVRKRAYKVTANSKYGYTVSPNLLKRNFSASEPNSKWVGDITYIPTDEDWLYAAIVKDLCSKKVVGYAFSNRIDSELTVYALELAVKREKPFNNLIFHSDRGVHYASKRYRKTLAKYNITQSMSRKGDPYDNAVAEFFFSCLKCELVHLKHYRTRDEAQIDILAYIWTFYNTLRPHFGIGWLSPCAYKEKLLKNYAA
ncbi:MAG: IS3 family transposase [Clostridiales bacterium]|nr:MAG: IS3 family transposase [Clostridiales bacterium]